MRSQPRSAAADALTRTAGWAAVFVVLAVSGWLVGSVLGHGLQEVSWSFLTSEPLDAGRNGGIGTVLVSTALVLSVCLGIAVPLGVGAAVWLSEFARPSSRPVALIRRSLDLLASVPSIVFGLFGMVVFCQELRLGFSIAAGGLTLACMILPLVVQTTFAGLRSVPDELRLGAAALAISRSTALRHLLLPAALHGVVVGVMLGLGRAAAETAALIFTSGYVTRMPESLLDSGRTVSVHIYDLAMNVPGGEARAYASAAVLLCLLLIVNVAAAVLADRWLRHQTARVS
ncbi:phosphate ABC transporter permease PstA [bacterium]|nr:phosphate ABC transporter permease PstA [bacterium]